MANRFNWSLGHEGKGNVYSDGDISTWNINEYEEPHHDERAAEENRGHPAFRFYITPEGGLHDGGLGFTNQTPYNDDQVVKEIISQHPAVWDSREDFHGFRDESPFERIEAPGGGYGHAYKLMQSKLASSGWADFHTEYKIPRGVRKQIRRWVDRLKWPEGSEKMDAREYHITVLDMEVYDEDFAKWARKQVQGKTLHFKSQSMDMFNEFVVVRLECPEWTELAVRWGEEAEKRGLEPHRFPGGPKAHISVGKSANGKWPQGIPNPHVKFETRMFNVKRNSAVPPRYLYHYSPPQNIESIEQNGLHTRNPVTGESYAEETGGTPDARQPGVYMFGDSWEPIMHAQEDNPPGGVWRVDTHGLDIQPDPDHLYPDSNIWVHRDHIPPERLERVDIPEIKRSAVLNEFGQPEEDWDYGRPWEPGSWGKGFLDILNKNGSWHESAEVTPADDLKAWLDSFTPQQEQTQPSLHHTDADQFMPQVVAPVVQTPHIDPPSQPYKPYNWAEEGFEESPLDRTHTEVTAMAADPNWIRNYIQERGPYLYHGARSRDGVDPETVAQSILTHGILPDQREPDEYPGHPTLEPCPSCGTVGSVGDDEVCNVCGHQGLEYALEPALENWWHNPRRGHVFLTHDPSLAYGEPTFRIDLRKLDPSKLKADDDFLREERPDLINFHKWTEPTPDNPPRDLGQEAERVGWGDDPQDTHDSLSQWGVVAHEGRIPPEAIERIPTPPRTAALGSHIRLKCGEESPLDRTSASEDEEMFVPGMARQPVQINPIGWPQTTAKPHFWNWEPQGHEPSRTPFLYNRNTRTIHLGRPGMIHAEMYNAAGVPTEGDLLGEWGHGELKHHPAELSDEPSWFTYGSPHDPDRDEIYTAIQQHLGEPLRDIDAEQHTSALDTRICPQCGEDTNSPICTVCGYDPQNSPDDYKQMKSDWYDRAWSEPGNQPRPVPNQPMHWGPSDNAYDVKYAGNGWYETP